MSARVKYIVDKGKVWDVISGEKFVPGSIEEIFDAVLINRGIIQKRRKDLFLNPPHPASFSPSDLGIGEDELSGAVSRIKQAVKKDERIIIYGDYDADGVCATATLWETLYSISKKTLPYIPNRFTEGYGINPKSVEEIIKLNPDTGLIITVDNGIVAFDGIKKARELGIDIIVTDHHTKEKKLPEALSIIHTTKLSGSGIAWFFAKEIWDKLKINDSGFEKNNGLDLAAIGTIADQLPLTDINRSVAKFGLMELNKSSRPGIISMFEESGIKSVGVYEVNYILAPRINAMGRMQHAIDSLRLLCTTDTSKARSLALFLGRTNRERQSVVESVVSEVVEKAGEKNIPGPIIISGKYHEGVIGLAAGKLAETFYRPSIVISLGEGVSKASGRSIPGFDIISAIRKLDDLLIGGGGHPMAAGFTIKNENIKLFEKRFLSISSEILKGDILKRRLKIDLFLPFPLIGESLMTYIVQLNPTGIGNPAPVFATKEVFVESSKAVGVDGKHLKVTLVKDGKRVSGIGFGFGHMQPAIDGNFADIAYSMEENTWNGNTSIELMIKDIKLNSSSSNKTTDY